MSFSLNVNASSSDSVPVNLNAIQASSRYANEEDVNDIHSVFTFTESDGESETFAEHKANVQSMSMTNEEDSGSATSQNQPQSYNIGSERSFGDPRVSNDPWVTGNFDSNVHRAGGEPGPSEDPWGI